jgi:steroid delta-isomerase-like uncharacterized protein
MSAIGRKSAWEVEVLRRSVLTGAAILVAAPGAVLADEAAPVPEKFAAALGAHDMAAFAALFAEDYVNHQTSAAAPPPAAGVPHKTSTVNFFAARLKALPDLSVTIEAMVAQGERAAASFVYEGTHQGVYFGVAPTGKRLRFTSCDIFRVAGGLIAEHWGMGDIAGVLAQLKG